MWWLKNPRPRGTSRQIITGGLSVDATAPDPVKPPEARKSVLGNPIQIGAQWFADAWDLAADGIRPLLNYKKLYDNLKRHTTAFSNLADKPLVHNHSTLTGHVSVDPGHEVGNTSVIAGGLQINGAAEDEPSRGLYVYDNLGCAVWYFRGDRWVQLPDIPDRATIKTNWTLSNAWGSGRFGSMGSTLFAYQGKLVLVLYTNLPTNALRIFAFDFEMGSWDEITSEIEVVGEYKNSLGYQFKEGATFPYVPLSAGDFTPAAKGDTVFLRDGEAVFIEYSATGVSSPAMVFEFFSDSATGFQGITSADAALSIAPSKPALRVRGNANCALGTTDTAVFAGKYTTPGAWQQITVTSSGNFEGSSGTSRWLVLVASGIGAGKTVGFRRISISPTLTMSMYMSKTINYRGNIVWTGYSTLSGELFSFSLTGDKKLYTGRTYPIDRQPRKQGDIYSSSQNNLNMGRLIPHLDRLRHINEYLGGRNRWDVIGGGRQLEFPLFAPYRASADPDKGSFDTAKSELYIAHIEAGLTGATLWPTKERTVFGLPFMFLGGVSHQGFLFYVNVLGQLVRFDPVHRVPKIMVDIPYELTEFDCGLSTTDADGDAADNGYSLFFTRTEPAGSLPYDLPESLRGWGRLGVEFWDAFCRLQIVSIPPTGDPLRDARLATMVGRRGLHSGLDTSDAVDGSKKYWAVAEDGRHLFSNSFNPVTKEWNREQLPAGTVVRSRYSFGSGFMVFPFGENPAHLKMFEYDGDMYVLWIFSFNQFAGPLNSQWPVNGAGTGMVALTGAKVPPSMLVRFHYDPESDTMSVVSKTTLLVRGEGLSCVGAVSEIDDRVGTAWVMYMSGGFPTQQSELISIDLKTMGMKYHGPVFGTIRNYSGSFTDKFDTRNRIYDSGIVSFNFNEPQAYVHLTVPDPVNNQVKVYYRLSSPNARPLNIRVRFAYVPSGLGDFRPATPFTHATEHHIGSDGVVALTSSVGAGTEHVFVHDISKDLEAPISGHLQYEILPYDQLNPIDATADIEVDLWAQGIVGGCDQDINSIRVDGVGISSVPIANTSTCRECTTAGAQTPGAVFLKSGLLSILKNSVLEVCSNHVDNQNPDCVFEGPLDSATMWLSPRGASPAVTLCSATALPGEIVTFGVCSLSLPVTPAIVQGTSTCEPELIPTTWSITASGNPVTDGDEIVVDQATTGLIWTSNAAAVLTRPDSSQTNLSDGTTSLTITLSPGDNTVVFTIGGIPVATLKIIRLVWSMANVAPTAGDPAEFHVVRTDGGSSLPISYATADGTAVEPGDYTETTGAATLDGADDEQIDVPTDAGAGGKNFTLTVEVSP